MSVLYLDCCSGISGDMTVGALLDLGADAEALAAGLASLDLPGWKARHARAMKGVLAGTRFEVEVEETGPERSLPEILGLIEGASIPEGAKARATKAFRLLAEAEGAVHGMPPEQVHFHEVGAADSIVDIVGAALCVELLKPSRVVVSPIPMARGFVKCRHGLIPLPAPATLNLAVGIPIRRPPAPTTRELATPTGLALAKAMADGFGELPEGTVAKVGIGIGKANFEWPNVLRAILLEEAAVPGRVRQIEANLDDMTPEALAHALDRLLAEGALDAWLVPIHMKKGRPGFTLGVLCEPAEGERLAALILRETTTLGVRFSELDRVVLPREMVVAQTPYGPIRCKVAAGPEPKVKPEFEDCRKAAEASGATLAAVTEAALRALKG